MRYALPVFVVMCVFGCCSPCARAATEAGPVFSGMSDASAAVDLGAGRIVVGDDETNSLRIFNTTGGAPLSTVELAAFLELDRKNPESDIEAAARIGDRIYWITSHGRSKEGKQMPNRQRLFATDIVKGPDGATVKPVGQPCKTLAEAIAKHPDLHKLDVDASLSVDAVGKRADLAPKAGGFNIEGLCASLDGKTLYVGLRNPRHKFEGSPEPHAIVIPILNPSEVVNGKTPELGAPLHWNLGGFGIRDVTWSASMKTYVVIAGPHDDNPGGVLYTWSGQVADQPQLMPGMDGSLLKIQPEAVICFAESNKILILSDDGNVKVKVESADECLKENQFKDGMAANKHLRDLSKRSFRSAWVAP